MLIVADENIPGLEESFGQLGELRRFAGRSLSPSDLKDADVLLVRSVSRVDERLLRGSQVRFVGSATIGIDHLDTQYLEAAGIAWSNAPGSNADSVVEYVISALCRLDGALQQLQAGATVGIIGMGNVGSQLYRRLDRLGVPCIAYDPLIDPTSYSILVSFEEVLAADVICLHTPLTLDGPFPTYHMINHEVLEQLRPGTILINAGRGSVIDGLALRDWLQQRDDIAVVLDVWDGEPDIDLQLMQRVDLATPHIAGYSYDGKLAGTNMIFKACCKALELETLDDSQLESAETRQPPLEEIVLRSAPRPVDWIRRAVLAAYDVAEDDQRMRGGLLHRGEQSVAEAFDSLRRQYPVRREFSHHRLNLGDDAPQAIIPWLQDLGFHLSND